VVHFCNTSIVETKAGELKIHGQPMLHNEFEASLDYIAIPCSTPPTHTHKEEYQEERGDGEVE
jgi:hypothetical protein